MRLCAVERSIHSSDASLCPSASPAWNGGQPGGGHARRERLKGLHVRRPRPYPEDVMPLTTSLRKVVVAVLPALLVGAGSAAAQQPLPHSAAVQLSSARAGARPVALTLQLAYEMQCGYPGPGPLRLELPVSEHVPAVIAASAVLVDGKAAPAVRVAGDVVTVALPQQPRVMCDVIGPGRLTVELTRAAGLGNPARAGSYMVTATRESSSFSARFTIDGGSEDLAPDGGRGRCWRAAACRRAVPRPSRRAARRSQRAQWRPSRRAKLIA